MSRIASALVAVPLTLFVSRQVTSALILAAQILRPDTSKEAIVKMVEVWCWGELVGTTIAAATIMGIIVAFAFIRARNVTGGAEGG